MLLSKPFNNDERRIIPMIRDNSGNKRYSKLEKEKLITKLFPLESISVTELSKETGISKSTLQTWKT